MELEDIKHMNIDPKIIRENMQNKQFGESTPETELSQLVRSNTHRRNGWNSKMYKVEGREDTPRSVKHIDKFVKSYFPSFYDDYIFTKKEIYSYFENEEGNIDEKKLPNLMSGEKDKYHLGECCHYSLNLTLGLYDYYSYSSRDKDGKETEYLISARWRDE